jgi:hypothetical protein
MFKSNQKFVKFFWCLMSIYLFNISVDTTNLLFYENSPKGVVNNEQDSIVEIILEQVLDFEDFVKETDCEDNDTYLHKIKLVKNVVVRQDYSDPILFLIETNKKECYFNQHLYLKILLRKDIPPPKC